jgi:cysteinyl-tRNA synthetase
MVCNHSLLARYWIHNNMITIDGRKMGKSYNNVIKLTEIFSGNHPALQQAYHPMVIRFFILQTHYRSTLDFGNSALQAAEKGLKRLWDAYEKLESFQIENAKNHPDKELNEKINRLVSELDEFMNDDFNTAKVLANLFEIVPVINGIKDRHIDVNTLSEETLLRLKKQMKFYLEDILGLMNPFGENTNQLKGVIEILISLRQEAKVKKDYAAGDKIRNELAALGIQLKDEKDGGVSYNFN